MIWGLPWIARLDEHAVLVELQLVNEMLRKGMRTKSCLTTGLGGSHIIHDPFRTGKRNAVY